MDNRLRELTAGAKLAPERLLWMMKPGHARSFGKTIARCITIAVGTWLLHASGADGSASPVKLSVDVPRFELWVGERIEVGLRISIRLPPAIPGRAEPLRPARPPDLRIPFLESDNADVIEWPDINSLLMPLLDMNTNLPALTINAYTVTSDPLTGRIRLSRETGVRMPTARFHLNRRSYADSGERRLEYFLSGHWTARSEGTYIFGAPSFSGLVAVGYDEQIASTAWRHVSVTGEAVRVEIASPPQPDRPELFFGAVGADMQVDLRVGPQTCRLGDPITIGLLITGDINHEALRPPQLHRYGALQDKFRINEHATRTIRADGKTEFLYIAHPVVHGAIEIPALEFKWLESARRHYALVTTRALPLQVLPPHRAYGRDTIVSATDPPAPLRRDADGWAAESWRDQRDSFRLAALGPLQFLLLLFLISLPGGWRALKRRYRRRNATRALKRRLHRLLETTDTQSPMLCARSARAAINRFFADVFHFNIYTLTPAELWRTIAEKCPSKQPSPAARDVIERCHHQCFSERPVAVFDPRNDIRRLLKELSRLPLDASEQKKVTAIGNRATQALRGTILPFTALIMSVALFLAPRESGDTGQAFADAHIRKHLWHEANHLAASARTGADFDTAFERYIALIETGARNASLYYNYGTLRLHSGDIKAAAAALRQAATIEGLSGDIRHNLRLATSAPSGIERQATTFLKLIRDFIPHQLAYPGLSTAFRLAALFFVTTWLAASAVILKSGDRRRYATNRKSGPLS